jgi:hypothetical protein
MSQNSNLNLLHIGLQSSAAAWGTVASSLVSLDTDPANPAIDKERLQSPSMSGDGLEVASRPGKTIADMPSIALPLRGCKSGGAGDTVSSGGGTANTVLDVLLQSFFGQAPASASGETTDATDAGSGTTVTADAASAFTAGDGLVVAGTTSGKLNARQVVSVSSADITVDRALLNDGSADTADENTTIYAMDSYKLDFDGTNHKAFTLKHSKDGGQVDTFIGCQAASLELAFPRGGDAKATFSGIDFSDYSSGESASTYSAPTVGDNVVCLDSPFFIGGTEAYAYDIAVNINTDLQMRAADGTPRGHAGFAAVKKTVECTAKILLGSLGREYAEGDIEANLRAAGTLDVAFQHGRSAGAISYVRIPAASTQSAKVVSENGQEVLVWTFRAVAPSSGEAFTLHLG